VKSRIAPGLAAAVVVWLVVIVATLVRHG